ncbi:flavin reductase family protein [Vibrio porteresiae]|uniref:Flavin reductase family protein n=1 Tax=Vibrio porteresiae DSM 19223 TaxID=1123496 RepID=A0ABZ0Q7I4_9VIBR|nr:flavin reductase family protein [Vibrio porteresiae]WPC72386.1 flavin reductase family protein [Vibrio porteresiae DSM 19223]
MNIIPNHTSFTLLEPGPVVFVTTHDGNFANIMTISWSMVMSFEPRFALTTGAWNCSYTALEQTRECTIAIPSAEQIDLVVGVGTCSGRDTDKFAKFGLTQLPGQYVKAPLIAECMANIECKVVDIIEEHHIIVLEGLAAYTADDFTQRQMLHAVGDGTFIADGAKLDRREAMASKLPQGW